MSVCHWEFALYARHRRKSMRPATAGWSRYRHSMCGPCPPSLKARACCLQA